ncbi:MAG: DNA recombination protein RmuC [Pseudomonadota bacterium]
MAELELIWAEILARPWAVAALGAILGALLVYLGAVRSLKREIAAVSGARTATEEELQGLRAARAAQDVSFAKLEERAAQVDGLEERVDTLNDALIRANEGLARSEATLKSERESHAARLEELHKMREGLQKDFDVLASKALDANNERFLKSVSERFAQHKQRADADLEARQKGIETLLKPIQDSLGKFEHQVGEIEKARAGAYAQITQQVTSLAQSQQHLTSETNRLVTALRAPKTRGNWGEFQLRQVVEMAGMVDHVDFHMEQSVEMDEGRRRPDATVNLPGGKRIVIDAKTSLEAYLTASNMDEGPEKISQMEAHVRQLRTQMKGLAQKSYFEAIAGSPDFVVMFIPGEGFYSTALSLDPTLFEDAIRNKIIIATPTTLVALLKSVAYGWQQERMAENAQEAVEAAQELHKRFATLGDRLERLGKSISNTVRDFNATISTAEARVLPQARKFETMQIAVSGTEIVQTEKLDVDVKTLSAPEFKGDTAAE